MPRGIGTKNKKFYPVTKLLKLQMNLHGVTISQVIVALEPAFKKQLTDANLTTSTFIMSGCKLVCTPPWLELRCWPLALPPPKYFPWAAGNGETIMIRTTYWELLSRIALQHPQSLMLGSSCGGLSIASTLLYRPTWQAHCDFDV